MAEPPEVSARITIPLFPLPDVVLFPGQILPLHIFEPRYRRMVEDLLSGGDRRLGMAVLRPGWEEGYEGCPAIYETVGFGVVEEADRLADGRFNIRLRGEGKGHVESEIQQVPYRKAVLVTFEDRPPSPELGTWVGRLRELLAELGGELGGGGPDAPAPGDMELLHSVAAALDVRPEVKLGLLELDDPGERARRVVEVLEEALALRRSFDDFRPRGDWNARHN